VVTEEVTRLPDISAQLKRLSWYYQENGGNYEDIKEVRAKDNAIETKRISKKIEGGSQARDAPVNGIIVVEGRKHCKNCGNALEE